jgi:hypothetical protein
MDKIYLEIIYCEIKYSGLSNETRAQITFPQYVALRNPSWSEENVLHGIIVTKEKRSKATRWMEEQRDPTPIRSTQLCYSCKVPWELDHRCRGKGQKHIIKVRHDSDDEACEDGSIDAYLKQSDDNSDSCIEASDSCTLEDDSDPRTLEEQWDGQDDNTYASTVISHIVDDLTPQQSGDTSEDSHVLAPTDNRLPMVTVTHLSSLQTPMTATSYEGSSSIEEPYVRDAHHGSWYYTCGDLVIA